MKPKTILLFLILICASSPIISQITHTVQFDPQWISIGSKEGDDRNMYAHMEMPSAMFADVAGNPELPVYYINYIIPSGNKVTGFTITASTTTSYQLNYPIYPTQLPIPCGLDCDPVPFVSPNPAIYNSTNVYPLEILSVQHQGYLDGANNIIQIKVAPIQYSPLTNQISFYSSITFDLILEEGFSNGIIHQRNRISKNQAIYDETLFNLVSNPEDIGEFSIPPTIIEQISQNGPLPYFEYVIVTIPEFFSAFDEFIEWKSKKGIHIGLVSISDIAQQYIGDLIFPDHWIEDEPWIIHQANAGKLRQYLHDAYIEGTNWVLLAGDVSNQLPARLGTSEDTDLTSIEWGLVIEADTYFADFTGNWNVDGDNYFGEPTHDSPDYFPELFLGRLICSSEDDIRNWVTKVLKYEQNPGNGDFAYLTKSFMTEADEFQRDGQANAVMPHLPTFNHTVWGEDPSFNHSDPTSPKGAEVVTELNSNNYGLMSVFNHGGTGLGNSGFGTATRFINDADSAYKLDAEENRDWHRAKKEDGDGLDNLLNYDHPFIIYSLSCVQNPFHLTKSVGNGEARNFGESFTVNNLAGGVAHLGTTRSANPNFTFHMFKSFGDLISSTENQYSTHLGVAESASKTLNFFHHYTAYSHTLIGCPETRIWTQTPVYFSVEIDKHYIKNNEPNDLTVNILNLPNGKDAIVSLYKQGELLLNQLVTGNASNTATAQFNQFELQTDGELFVTISSQNYIPYQGSLPVFFVVDTDQTWTSDVTMDSDIFVAECAELTIACTVSMGSEKKIMVTQCSKIIIDQGVITSITDQPWQGIQVWGNKNAHQWLDAQGNLAQGYLELNDAVIENAVDAVVLWKPGDYATTGGIVYANNTVFRNNNRSVHALYYQNYNAFSGSEADYRAAFNNCDFVLDNNYNGTHTFVKHIDLNNVKGIRFTACDFSLSPDAPNVSAWNMGIGAYSAGFWTMAKCNNSTIPCNDWQNSNFNGFTYGIYAAGDQSITNTFKISRTHFNNNTYGIRNLGVSNFVVLNSEFHIGYNEPESDPCELEGKGASGYGIHMTGSTGFAIEENYFTKAIGAPTGNYTGIYIAETQATDQVYRNTFDGLSYGNYAVGRNWKTDYFEGLAYYCNENTGNYADFFVEPDNDPYKVSGIQSKQGDDNFVTGNTFTTTGNTWHFFNGGDYLVGYYYCNYCDDESPDETKIFQVTDKPKTFSNNCPSHYGGGGGSTEQSIVLTTSEKQEAELEFAVNLSNYNNVKTLYDDLKDGGNTETVIADIENAWPTDMWELRAELLGKSPHLSMEVLKAAADKTDVLPESIIFEVLAANPDELKKEELIKYLEDKADPLPGYMINILRHVAQGTTYKTVLEQHMAHYNQVKTRAAYDIVRSLLNDTITDFEQLRNWLDNVGGKRADEQIIATYLSEHNYANALALANLMPSLYAYSGNELIEHSFYMDLLNQQINLEQQQRTISDLDSLEVANLIFIAENSQGTAGLQAKGILEYAYGHHFCNCLNISDMSGFKRSGSINPDDLAKLHGVEINAHPNPASQWVAFNYTLPANTYQGEIKIVDAKGAVITSFTVTGTQGQQVWDSRSVTPGVYFYTLSVGEFTKSGKIVINK